jgi:hypothetical protein
MLIFGTIRAEPLRYMIHSIAEYVTCILADSTDHTLTRTLNTNPRLEQKQDFSGINERLSSCDPSDSLFSHQHCVFERTIIVLSLACYRDTGSLTARKRSFAQEEPHTIRKHPTRPGTSLHDSCVIHLILYNMQRFLAHKIQYTRSK